MTKPLESLISSEIADFFAGFVEIHTELGGPNTVEEAQQQLTERVTRIASECEAALIAALEQKDKYITELREWNAGLAQESCEQQQRIAELEASQLAVKLPPHKFSECVNELLEGAIAYAGTQQLRAQLSTRLSNFVKPDHPAGITVQGDE